MFEIEYNFFVEVLRVLSIEDASIANKICWLIPSNQQRSCNNNHSRFWKIIQKTFLDCFNPEMIKKISAFVVVLYVANSSYTCVLLIIIQGVKV